MIRPRRYHQPFSLAVRFLCLAEFCPKFLDFTYGQTRVVGDATICDFIDPRDIGERAREQIHVEQLRERTEFFHPLIVPKARADVALSRHGYSLYFSSNPAIAHIKASSNRVIAIDLSLDAGNTSSIAVVKASKALVILSRSSAFCTKFISHSNKKAVAAMVQTSHMPWVEDMQIPSRQRLFDSTQ